MSLYSKLVTSQPGKQTIEIHRTHNFSRSKGKHTMKVYQVTEYNMRNIFLEYKKICKKYGREATPRPFSKK